MIDGKLEHTDTLNNISRASPGQVQHMWCGSGIWHTEKCISDIPARYLQIWFKQAHFNTTPFYEIYNRETTEFSKLNIKIDSEFTVSAGFLNKEYNVKKSYLYIISGSCLVGNTTLYEGDGGELDNETIIPVSSPHIILFEI